MERRRLLRAGAVLCATPAPGGRGPAAAQPAAPLRRARPGDPAWPSEAEWEDLGRRVGGRLIRPRSPIEACRDAPPGCEAPARDGVRLRNPFYLGDEPALTQASGWAGAWTSAPSAYAVAARDAADVAAAVDFARARGLRLVVKGGGHSYQGTSSAPDSLLVWTRRMDAVALHDGFVPRGCAGSPPRPAVSLGAGAIWGRVYARVAAEAGRYVQGGGCATVGVAGLVLGGGFGSFSKRYGLAAAGLLEAEVVTADGAVRVANACREPELFWALKGGGGGSFGVVTRLTLRTHDLPETFGGVFWRVQARSAEAFRRLIAQVLAFCAERLVAPAWGEQIAFRPDHAMQVAMVFQGIDEAEAAATWRPLLDRVAAAPADYAVAQPFRALAVPARRFWDGAWMLREAPPGIVAADDRPGAAPGDVFWAGDAEQAGQYLHAYESRWLPAALLATPDRRAALAEALFEGSRHWAIGLHLNKGLAGAPAEAVAAARDTATHPSVLDAFALAIVASHGPPAFPGMAAPDQALARDRGARVAAAAAPLRRLAPEAGSYVAEASYFEPDWQRSHWGPHYARLLAAKRRYDPGGLFFVHHGVGTEGWSADGFARAAPG